MKFLQPIVNFRKALSITVFLALFSILVGGLIYLAFRPKTLVIFGWIEGLGLVDEVNILRDYFAPFLAFFPSWVILSLPHALWTFSLTLFLALPFWGNVPWEVSKKVWLLIPLLISIGMEILQLIGLKGKFDLADLIAIVIGYGVALFYLIAMGVFDGRSLASNN